MATIPLFSLGRNVNLVRLTAQAADAAGLLSAVSGGIAVIQAVLEEVDLDDTMNTEEVSAITSPWQNHVLLDQGARIRVTEILTPQASSLPATGPRLAVIRTLALANSGVVKVEWNHTAANGWTYYGLISGYQGPIRGKGKQTASMSFLPVDVGTANPLYSTVIS